MFNAKILDRYIFSQVLKATLFGLLIFIIVWISPEILFKIIRKFIYGEIDFILALRLFFLEIPEILSKAIPVGLLLGSLFVFDRLSRDSELTIIKAAGVNTFRLVVPIIFLSLIGMVICFFIYKDCIPYTTSEIKQLKGDVYQQNFVYIDKTKDKKLKQIIILGGYTGEAIYDAKLLTFSPNKNGDDPLMKSISTSTNVEIKPDHWELINGIEYEIGANGVYKDARKFDKMSIFDKDTSNKAEQLLIYSTKRPREMSNTELNDYHALLQSLDMNEEYRFSLSKYYQRFSHSFGCVLLAICGVLLGTSRPREKRFIGFTVGAGLIFVYYILVPFLDMLAQTGAFTPALSAWFPNIIVLATIAILLRYKNFA